MFRRNPDAVAIAIIAFFMLLASVPRMLFFEPSPWRVTPLNIEVPLRHEVIQAEKERIRAELDAHRSEMKAHRDEIRSAIKESIREAVH